MRRERMIENLERHGGSQTESGPKGKPQIQVQAGRRLPLGGNGSANYGCSVTVWAVGPGRNGVGSPRTHASCPARKNGESG